MLKQQKIDIAEESTTKSITEKSKIVTQQYSTENGEKEQDNALGM
jgi:hypothetical protein